MSLMRLTNKPSFVKSEMQRTREVMTKDGYEVIRVEYHFFNDRVSLVRPERWEELRVTMIDRRQSDPEVFQVYIEAWLLAYNLSMWEAIGFRGDTEDPQYKAKFDAWTAENPAPTKEEKDVLSRTLYDLAVTE